ncbi:28S ribosomal protein S14, mitochondrial [Brienomyrus brachyistius]|uniref:28S ribosomal protein S14, mitochondrial n=1 Tax=Brienomyrus brachyistius TaxID=42636 RepID=UPI0020B37454|nr:28S ribosomal protein S14, mitochondrial [Brienomyrus brachyistius]
MASAVLNKVVNLGSGVLLSSFCASLSAFRSPVCAVEQVRGYYVNWKMLRDVKRRKMAFEYADERLRINALRKNTILPKELQEVADKEIADLPRDSCPVRIRNRCVMTSRPRGVKKKWRLSRIVFRHLSDHNQMSGIQRAMW